MFKALFFFLCLFSGSQIYGQLSHFGITGGLSMANQRYLIHATDEKFKRAERYTYNAGIYTEWGAHDLFTWIVELQYDRKGSRPDDGTALAYDPPALLQMISLNNYAKFRLNWYGGSPYVLLGPRVEYSITASPYPAAPLTISGSAGIGYEWNRWEPWIPFVELHYVLPFTNSYNDPIKRIRERNIELKIGLKFRRRAFRSFDDCPPVYTQNSLGHEF